MEEKINKKKSSFLLILIWLIPLTLMVILDPLHRYAQSFLDKTFGLALANLGGVVSLNLAAGFIPVLDGVSDILNRVINFLLLSGVFLLLQMILLELSHAWPVRLLLLITAGGLIPSRTRKAAARILCVLLLVNPGLSFYLLSVKALSGSIHLELGSGLAEELGVDSTDNAVLSPGSALQTNSSPAKHEFSFWKKLFTPEGRQVLGNDMNKTAEDVKQFLQTGLSVVLNYFASILVLFVILPVLYLWVLFTFLKRVFRGEY